MGILWRVEIYTSCGSKSNENYYYIFELYYQCISDFIIEWNLPLKIYIINNSFLWDGINFNKNQQKQSKTLLSNI